MRSRLFGLFALFALAASAAPAAAAWIDQGDATPVRPRIEATGDGASVIVDVELPGYDMDTVDIDGVEHVRLGVPGQVWHMEPGLPELPYLAWSIAIAGEGTPELRVLESEWTDIAVAPPVPSKGHLTRDVDPASIPYRHAALYREGGVYPEAVTVLGEPFVMRDLRGVPVRINAFRWDAATGVLSVLRRMRLEVATTGVGGVNVKPVSTTRVDGQFDRLYRGLFANYGADKYAAVDATGPMLVVADDALAGAVAPFVAWKQQKGQTVELITTSSVGGTAAGIQGAVTTRYQSAAGLTYLVLVGDLAQVPTNTGTYESADSDSRYAMVDGSDLYPDLFVSRISATNVQQVADQVEKFVRYERDPDLGAAADWYHMGTGLASNEGTPADYERVEWLRQDLLGYTFSFVDEIYQPTGTTADITAALNAGRSLINYVGHGSGTSWSNPYFSVSDVHALENGWTQPWILDVSCSNGDFSTSECFAEAWLRATGADGNPNGAVATYSASTLASWVPPCEMQAEAVDLLVADTANVLGALYYSGGMQVLDLYPGTGTEGHKLIEQYNIFGDCSLMVRTDTPVEFAPVHMPAVFLGTPTYEVSGLPEGALACLWRDGVIHGTGVAGAGGVAAISVDEPILTPGDVTLTVTGYNLDTYQAVLPAITPSVVTIDPLDIDAGVTEPVTVTVMDSDGVTPLVGVDVWAEGLGYVSATVPTDAAGVAVLEVTAPYGPILDVVGRDPAATYDLFREPLTVHALALAGPDLFVTTDFGMSDMFGVSLPGTLNATVDEPGHTLYLILPDGTETTTTASTLVGTPTEAGTVTGIIAVPGYDLYTETFEAIEATGTVAGTVTDGAKAPLGGVQVRLYDQVGGTYVGTATTGLDGAYEMTDPIGVGDYVLEAVLFGYEFYESPVFVAYGTNTIDAALSAAPAGELSGVVTEAGTGAPLDAQVRVYRTDTGELYAETDTDPADGGYLLPDLTYFTYDVRVTAYQHTPVVSTVEIAEPGTVKDFVMEPTQGNILVIDDTPTAARMAPDKYDDKGHLLSKGGLIDARVVDPLTTELVDLGYSIVVETPTTTDPAGWWSYDLILVSSGDNLTTVADATFRAALAAHAQAGGHILVEGGEVAYDHYSADPAFAADVLHISSWNGDSSGNPDVADALHPVMSLPNPISGPIPLSYVSYGDADRVTLAGDAQLIGDWDANPGYGSVVGYDPTPSPVGGQIVFFTFNWYALDAVARVDLLHNAVTWLLAAEEPGTASVSGTVTLQGLSDHSGVQVQILPGGDTVTTGPDGSYEFTGLFASSYTVRATLEGWSVGAVDVTLAEGEMLTGQDMVLTHIVEVSECATPALAIPDNDPAGVTDVINMPYPTGETVSSVEVYVDITHTWQGDLQVSLTSPGGVTVLLHDRTGSSADDLLGWYPTDLAPAGDLADFGGGLLGGDWTLTVSDNAGSDLGTLNEWCLRFEYGGGMTPVGETPGRVVLGQNYPNPFNPSTTIRFAVPHPARVSLAIYDLAGRRVRTLVDGDLPAATHTVVWDGRVDTGRRAASGAYYCRLIVDGETLTRKMTLVK